MYSPVATSATPRGGLPTDSGDSFVALDQVPRWNDADQSLGLETSFSGSHFPDPLALPLGADSGDGSESVSKFPVDNEVNSKIYLWRGNPWNLEVDAVVNSTNENMDEAHSSPGLHDAAGPDLAEECATLGGCRTGMAKVTKAYDLPARKIIHTVGPKYAIKYHNAAENALSHCYRSCLELLVENGLQSIAMGCIYTEAKNYPREPAAHVAIRTVRRFLEKQKNNVTAVVFCTVSTTDTEIYKRLLPLYFPRDKHEEQVALTKLPADVGDENGEIIMAERKIRIKALPKRSVSRPPEFAIDLPVSDVGLVSSYRGGVDSDGHPVMVVVGAHFLLRCLDLERFVLHVVKEFEPLIQKPFSIVYFHSAASLQIQPDLGWMRRLQQILGRKHQRNLHAIYVLHPTFGLKAAVFGLQLFVDNVVWKKVVYVDRLLQLFRYVPREQLTIPDFVFQHDLEVNGGTGLIVDPRTKYAYNRP
ncbi:ganglioside-induced differentiation-associated protein 2 isoform X3 [Vigna radiata var. radiata]|uniref:Ganglioside-induced differentiation-associated protein 2 isoform X3 n=1 Tax=Vigna radiata var. radiata TaxID=3916 RepID=A0A3Q0F5V0_VIGRR|nr:ganglioside-induced differentiation-associated protein 2 isoform X3 [Vigna radiata var. radiata]